MTSEECRKYLGCWSRRIYAAQQIVNTTNDKEDAYWAALDVVRDGNRIYRYWLDRVAYAEQVERDERRDCRPVLP